MLGIRSLNHRAEFIYRSVLDLTSSQELCKEQQQVQARKHDSNRIQTNEGAVIALHSSFLTERTVENTESLSKASCDMAAAKISNEHHFLF